MITQNLMLEFLTKAPAAQSEIKTGQKPQANSSSFKDIFSSTMNQTRQAAQTSKSTENVQKEKPVDKNSNEPKETVRTFKEAARSNVKEVKNEKVQSKPDDKYSKEADSTQVKEEDVKAKGKAVVETLAQVLGMNPEDMMKMLQSLNIKPEELVDSVKAEAAVGKISTALGLDTQQSQALDKLVELINTTLVSKLSEAKTSVVDSSSKEEKTKSSQEDGSKPWVKLEGVKVEVVKENNTSPKLNELAAVLKEKLQTIEEKLQQNPEQLMEEVSNKLDELIVKAPVEAEALINTKSVDTLKKSDTVKVDDKKEDSQKINTIRAENTDSKDNNTDSSQDGASEEKQLTSNVIPLQNVEAKGNEKELQFNNTIVNSLNKVGETEAATKVQKDVQINIPKNQIINQVVEKAKVILGAEKSEMIMELKPDSLGKLSLKIVTENGIVAAKFIAENQQVKEVLESNMQLLKDSLEKQGMSIQGFSVSVGQENSRRFDDGSAYKGKTSKGTSGESLTGIGTVNVGANFEATQRNNPYNWGDSKINLTA